MNTRFLLLTLLVSFFQFSIANSHLDPASAEKVAKNVYFERTVQQSPVDFNEISISDVRIENINNEPALYLFNFENGGFVIVSADDALPPYLGYDLTGYCPNEGVNQNFDNFLSTYIEQIAYIRQNNIEAEAEVAQEWKKFMTDNPKTLNVKSDSRSTTPLLINLWNQDSPYNMFCPADAMGPGGHVYAGCVATAMSMVMHYWRYPLQGTGSHGYNCDGYGYLFANFGETEYNFNQMQTEMDGDMPDIALLQYHCGVAVDMMYGVDGSGAYSWEVPAAIKNYFGYSNLASFKNKDDYSNTGWTELLKSQIDLGRPMYYSGFSNSGGHAFGCDAYDDANFFHFNFGWSGSSNGFYSIYDVGGFSSGQGALINFIPGSGYPYNYTGEQLLTGKSGSFEDGSGPVENYTSDNQVSWLISPQSPEDSISSITLKFSRFDLATDDELIVYDGATASASILGTFTGNTLPATLSSSGNELLVVLNSNGDQTANGFLAEYSSESPVWCSGLTILNDASGEISDGSQDFNYDNNASCKWMILPENPVPTTLYFTSFSTETGNDKLLIYDQQTMALLADISGEYDETNLPEPVTSQSGKFFIIFVTNNAITGNGWQAYYTSDFVGLSDPTSNESEGMIVFPNPANNEVTIQLNTEINSDTRLTIYNLAGAKIFENTLHLSSKGNTLTINTSDFKPGVYIVTAGEGGNFFRKELVIY